MVFQTLKALVGPATFHGVMTGCLKCQGAHITERERERGTKRGEQRAWQKEAGVGGGKEPTGRNLPPSLKSTNCSYNCPLRKKDTERCIKMYCFIYIQMKENKNNYHTLKWEAKHENSWWQGLYVRTCPLKSQSGSPIQKNILLTTCFNQQWSCKLKHEGIVGHLA